MESCSKYKKNLMLVKEISNNESRMPDKTMTSLKGRLPVWLIIFLIMSGVLGYSETLRAQELRYQPIVPHGNVGELKLPEAPKPAVGNTDILVTELKGIIFVDNQDLVISPAPLKPGVHIDSPKLGLIKTEKFRRVVNPYLGKPVSIAMLNSLARDVIMFYRESDYPVVDVSIPEQDVTNGVVYVVVVEARLGKAVIEEGCYFDGCVLGKYIHLNKGQRLSEQQLLEELRWLNENPFRRVNLELRPGDRYSETDVVFKVKDRRPLQLYAGYEDTGTKLTGLERLNAGAIWGNALWKDHTASYQFTANPDFKSLVSHSGVYVIPTKNKNKFIMYGSYATNDPYDPVLGIQYGGYYGETGFIFDKKLKTRHYNRNTWYEHRASMGFQYKNLNSTLDFGVPDFLASYPYVEVGQITFGYHGLLYQEKGMWAFGANLYVSPGGFSARNNTEIFDIYRYGADASYCYGNVRVERFHELGKAFRTYFKLEGQAANKNLIATEMFGLGGYDSVRGYDTYFLSADNALLFTAELQTAPKSLGLHHRFRLKDPDELSALLFYDHGFGWNNHTYGGYYEFKDTNLNSVGVGFRYKLNPCFNVRFDYGWQLNRNDLPQGYDPGRRAGRAHLSVSFSR